MAFLIIIGGLLFVTLIFGPQFWVKHVIKKHAVDRPDLPGTGGELAEHLIESFELQGVGVELSQQGDHYDPSTRTVRLSDENFNGTSLSAVAIATHEVGHAIQHMRGERLLALRQSLAHLVMWADKFAMIVFTVAPILAIFARTPTVFFLLALFGFALMAVRLAVHLVTLPVEFDASFTKALPILEQGNYLSHDDLPAARSVLRAAAFTYVAAALLSLVDIIRFIRFGR